MVSLKHKFSSPKSDGTDATLVKPSNWNDEHDLLTSAPNVYLGRDQTGPGAAQELPVVPLDVDDDSTLWTAEKTQDWANTAITAAIAAASALLSPKVAPPIYQIYDDQSQLLVQVADPLLNGIPQITAGNPMFTEGFTALDENHRIRVTCTGNMSAAVTANGSVALFIDGAADAVRATFVAEAPTPGVPQPFRLHWEGWLAVGAHSFEIRAGFFGAGMYANNFASAGPVGGGTSAWVLTIEELLTDPAPP